MPSIAGDCTFCSPPNVHPSLQCVHVLVLELPPSPPPDTPRVVCFAPCFHSLKIPDTLRSFLPARDMIAQAHNGSGKTTCFVLSMLSRVDPNLQKPQALCVCPTRELVVQNLNVLVTMAK